MVEAAQTSNKVLFEAFHYRYHPLLKRIREIIDSGEIGSVKEVFANMQLPWYFTQWTFPDDDIRFNFDLAGGILMDAGCYCVNAVRFASSSEPAQVTSAVPTGLVNGNVETGIRCV
jgi:predicted dehydrogenase